LLRAQADVIMTGISTVITDDPQLTCRLPGLERRSPHRLIADSYARISHQARILRAPEEPADRKVWLACSSTAAVSVTKGDLLAHNRLSGVIDCGPPPITLAPVLAALAKEPVRRLLVEAGPRLSRNFIESNLVDEAVIFRGSGTLVAEHSLEPLAGLPMPKTFEDTVAWRLVDRRRIGDSEMIIYRRNGS
jgi:diaminohydroxyphosphoribosylaminopyrimidine deaminase/5-amino-6-(5-phosphoribosylamino)uracil reductase